MKLINKKLLLSGLIAGLCLSLFASGDISGRLRRMEDDIKDLDKKLAKAEAGSRKALNLTRQREKYALEMIHSIQLELMDGGNKNDGRRRKLQLLLKNESNFLKKSLKDRKDFPGLDHLADISIIIQNIRSGKLKYDDKIPKSDSLLMRDIQKKQRDYLDKIHKEQLRNHKKKYAVGHHNKNEIRIEAISKGLNQ